MERLGESRSFRLLGRLFGEARSDAILKSFRLDDASLDAIFFALVESFTPERRNAFAEATLDDCIEPLRAKI